MINSKDAPEGTEEESLTFYNEKGPDLINLKAAYDRTVDDLGSYREQCQDAFDQRRNYWPGKSQDLRKHGSDAFPWDGASDTEAHVIDERIDALVSIAMGGLERANIRAFPVKADDAARAKIVSSFLKWMTTTYIPSFMDEMELAANYGFERGLLVSYVGWERRDSRYLQRLSLDEIRAAYPDLASLIVDGQSDDEIIALLEKGVPNLSKKRAKKALNQLRKFGNAELPIIRRVVDRPVVKACSPDGDVLFPAYCMDPQRAPYVFYRTFMTAQEILGNVQTEGWDKEWADYVVEHLRGVDTLQLDNPDYTRTARTTIDSAEEAEELIEVVYAYQRLIDEEDGAEGIYCTIFNPKWTGQDKVSGYAKFELMNGMEDYPIVVTRLSYDTKRMYDLQPLPEKMRGLQWQVKVERDSRADRNSMATLPPVMHPPGKPPADWGPGRYVPRNRPGDFEFGPAPVFNAGSLELEQAMLKTADNMVGLDPENPLGVFKQQFLISKLLRHARDVIKMAFVAFQRYGPDEVFFAVTGVPDAQKFTKGNPDEDYNILIEFDVRNTDPENVEKQIKQMIELASLDRNGRISIDELILFGAAAINPILADRVIQPKEAAAQQVAKDVTDDLTKIFSGIEVGARPNGGQVAIQIIQQYVQQPDVAQRAQQDEAFKTRLEKYFAQYAFQLTQAQNAEIGRIGTAPAQMGGMGTQTINAPQ